MFPINLQCPASDAEKLKHYYDNKEIYTYPKTASGMPDMRSTITRNMIQRLLVTRCCDEININFNEKLQKKHQNIVEAKRYTYNGEHVNMEQLISKLFKEYSQNTSNDDHKAFMNHIHIALYDILWHSSIDSLK